MAERDPDLRALDWSDAALDALTTPEAMASPDAVAEAEAWWRRHAAPEDRELLRPEPADDAAGADDGEPA